MLLLYRSFFSCACTSFTSLESPVSSALHPNLCVVRKWTELSACYETREKKKGQQDGFRRAERFGDPSTSNIDPSLNDYSPPPQSASHYQARFYPLTPTVSPASTPDIHLASSATSSPSRIRNDRHRFQPGRAPVSSRSSRVQSSFVQPS
jgi:hypothetical protein